MNVRYLRLLWLWGGILALLLCLLFLPLASGGRILAAALILAAVIAGLISPGAGGKIRWWITPGWMRYRTRRIACRWCWSAAISPGGRRTGQFTARHRAAG